jgi:hypothetical protein
VVSVDLTQTQRQFAFFAKLFKQGLTGFSQIRFAEFNLLVGDRVVCFAVVGQRVICFVFNFLDWPLGNA